MSPISPWLRHRGWLVVLGAFLIQVVGFGAIYSSSAFSAEIAASLGMDRADADLVMGLSLGLSFLVSAMSGSLADRFGPRLLAVCGMILVASGLALAALAQNISTLFLGYGLLLGIGFGLANVPAIAAVQRWFLVKRGLAAGLAAAGMGVGTVLVPILKDLLSGFGDWRAIFLCCAALAILVGLAGALLLDAQPERHGMGPDGTRLNPALTTLPAEGLSLGRALRSRRFQYALLGTLLVSIPVSAPLMLLVGSAEVRGLSHQQAIGLLGLVGAGSLSGRFILGAAADRLGRRFSFLVICFALGLAMFGWAAARDAWSLGAFALVYGVLQGSFVALLPAFAADSFGIRAIGSLIGALYTSRSLALLAGLPLMSAGIAFFGTFEVSVTLCGLAGLLGAFLLCWARPEASGKRKIAPAKTGQLALRLWLLPVLGLGTGMLAASPRGAAAEALVPDTAIRAANLPITQAKGGARSFAVTLADGSAIFDMPEAASRQPLPAVLIIHDASGADGRAVPYAEHLLGADIVVLELRDASLEAAGGALAALAADPRINPAKLGVLGFGEGARMALDLPGAAARALLYPGCARLPAARKMAMRAEPTPLLQRVAWTLEAGIRDFIGPAEYAWNYNVAGGAPGFAPAHKGAAILLLHGSEDPANPESACAALAETLRGQRAEVEHQEIPGAGYAWDYPQLGATREVLLPAPGMPERLSVRPWPAMAAQSAAAVAGFFALRLAGSD